MDSAGKRNPREEEIYQKKIESFDTDIEFYEKELKNLKIDEEKIYFDNKTILGFIRNAGKYYKKASYVQKREIIKILFLNIVVNNNKGLTVKLKPEAEQLFSRLVGDRGFEPLTSSESTTRSSQLS